MALATRCPHCNTTFRVAQDQLKLRTGLVRCGTCKEIFNGIEHLLRPDELEQAKLPPLPAGIDAKPDAAEQPPAIPVTPPAVSESSAAPVSQALPPAAPDIEADTVLPVTPQAEPVAPAPPIDAKIAKKVVDALPDPVEFVKVEEPPQAVAPPSPEPAVAARQPEHAGQTHNSPADKTPPSATPEQDPLQRMTLVDLSEPDELEEEEPAHASTVIPALPEEPATIKPADVKAPASAPASAPDPIDQAIDNLQRAPLRTTQATTQPAPAAQAAAPANEEAEVSYADEEFEEPGFVKRGRRRQRRARTIRVLMGISSFILLIGLIAQGSYVFRNEIAAWFPNTKPMLTSACSAIDCRIGLPAQIDAVSIESHELQTLPANKDMLVLTALLRNRSPIAQAWPNMELTLNDANGRMMARRVFVPREYLPPGQDAAKGFPSASEQTIKLYFELSQLTPSGYTVYLFYP